MRIWSLHPEYLDTKGLVALWREALLAKKVLEGRTNGYKKHPQLIRFKLSDNPLYAINQYLLTLYKEAETRGYCFDKSKIDVTARPIQIPVTTGQLEYEKAHLLKKLNKRAIDKYRELNSVKEIKLHPLFYLVDGGIEDWEIIK